jgi:hypothetical protein
MGILAWIKNRQKEPEDEPAPSPHVTDDGKPIKQLWRSDWYSDDYGLREYRHHVGQSECGFHGGLEVSYRGGEGPFKWSQTRPTMSDAEMVSYGMRDGSEFGDGVHGDLPGPAEVKAQSVQAVHPAAKLMTRGTQTAEPVQGANSTRRDGRGAVICNQGGQGQEQSAMSPADNNKSHTPTEEKSMGRDRGMER